MPSTVSASDLGRYLFLSVKQQEEHPSRALFNKFLGEMRMLYALRMKSEIHYKEDKTSATTDKEALPLHWDEVNNILNPKKKEPRLGIVTKVAAETTMILLKLLENVRKQLRRQREMTAIGRVQQLDAYCLQWISRRPGLTLTEKAGAKQQVLSIVRRENYDILENRVLKSFLVNVEKLAVIWMKDHSKGYDNHPQYRIVKRFLNIVRGLTSLECFNDVKVLHDIPIPNYTLQQDPHYSIIWKSYLLVVQYIQVSLRLWKHRKILNETLNELKTNVKGHIDSPFFSELWVHPIDGRETFFENYLPPQTMPRNAQLFEASSFCIDDISDNELNLRVIDLLGPHQDDALLLPNRKLHPTSKARLINYAKPYVDSSIENNTQYQQRIHYLNDILASLIKSPNNQETKKLLIQYFEQLHAKIKGRHWLILIPDFVEPEFQEVLRECARSVTGIAEVRLLWRTMAYALGSEGKKEVVKCFRKNAQQDKANFKIVDNRYQRVSYRIHKDKFTSPQLNTFSSPYQWYLPPLRITTSRDDALIFKKGAIRFWTATREEPAFYDQLLGLYIVIQDNVAETAGFKELIKPNEKHPGGFTEISERCSNLGVTGKTVKFFFHEGLTQNETAQLKLFEDTLNIDVDETIGLEMTISSSPGQGLTTLRVDYSNKHIDLVMHKVAPGYIHVDERKIIATLATINLHMERSFPPHMPDVESDPSLFPRYYVNDRLTPKNVFQALKEKSDLFAQARYKYGAGDELPKNEPLAPLVRCNVFGTHPIHRRPFNSDGWKEAEYNELFSMLITEFIINEKPRNEYNKSLRALAWTYQYDNTLFNELRKWCVQKVVKDSSNPVIITFCANFCRSKNEWILLLKKITEKHQYQHIRLLYNLLMFCTGFPQETNLHKNKQLQQRLVECLCRMFRNTTVNATRNAVLRSLLFLLRIRRFQIEKTFAKQDVEPEIYNLITEICQIRANAPLTANLQRLLNAYLNGKGTLDGLPALLSEQG